MQPKSPLSANELKDVLFSFDINKSSGYDDFSFNFVRICFDPLLKPLIINSICLWKKGIFPDDLKTARVTPIFKAGDTSELRKYRPISVLPCFSKILERIMYIITFKYLTGNKVLYKKQFGCREEHAAEHAIVKLIDHIKKSLEKNRFTLRVFIDFLKEFDTIEYHISIKKLNQYGVKRNNMR